MLKVLEAKIQNVSKNTYKELKITFLIKSEDYDSILENAFYDAKNNGQCGAFIFNPINVFEKVDRNKFLQDLGFFMGKYIEKIGGDLEQEKQRIYKKYNITSRTQLSIEQLRYEVDSYKTGLNYDE